MGSSREDTRNIKVQEDDKRVLSAGIWELSETRIWSDLDRGCKNISNEVCRKNVKICKKTEVVEMRFQYKEDI